VLLVSFLLVIVATIFLLSGLFLTKDLALIFISITCSALAGIVLVVAVMKSRPRQGAEPAGDGATLTPAPSTVAAGEAAAVAAATGRRPAAGRGGDAREFPIPDYDNLEVVEVLPLLGDLEPAELDMVRQREASGRAHPWILARVDALLEAEADADTSEHAWAPGPLGNSGQQGRLIDEEEYEDEDEIAEVEPDDADWASPRDRDWAASDFELDSGADYDEMGRARGARGVSPQVEFPIDRYDELRVTEILPLLATLGADDLKMVREEEAGGKARASILSRIDGLLARDVGAGRPAPAGAAPAKRPAAKAPSKAVAGLPIDGYDSLTVPQIQARLVGLTAPELRQLRTYEKRHKNRAGVLSRIEGALRQAPR
jgi:hypothetical protein